jgi:hypothetical protein
VITGTPVERASGQLAKLSRELQSTCSSWRFVQFAQQCHKGGNSALLGT